MSKVGREKVPTAASQRPVAKKEVSPFKKPAEKPRELPNQDNKKPDGKLKIAAPVAKTPVKKIDEKKPSAIGVLQKPATSNTPVRKIDPLKAKFLEKKFNPNRPENQAGRPRKTTAINFSQPEKNAEKKKVAPARPK